MDCGFTDVGCHLDWLVEKLAEQFHKTMQEILDGTISVLSAIPVPTFFNDITNMVNDIPPGAWFFIQSAEIGFGVWVLSICTLIRFAIRRLPIVG